MEFTDLELKHQEAPDLQSEQNNTGQPWAPCLTQLLEASFTDLHGRNLSAKKEPYCFGLLGCFIAQLISGLLRYIVKSS